MIKISKSSNQLFRTLMFSCLSRYFKTETNSLMYEIASLSTERREVLLDLMEIPAKITGKLRRKFKHKKVMEQSMMGSCYACVERLPQETSRMHQ